jgi:hypothetical protein
MTCIARFLNLGVDKIRLSFLGSACFPPVASLVAVYPSTWQGVVVFCVHHTYVARLWPCTGWATLNRLTCRLPTLST